MKTTTTALIPPGGGLSSSSVKNMESPCRAGMIVGMSERAGERKIRPLGKKKRREMTLSKNNKLFPRFDFCLCLQRPRQQHMDCRSRRRGAAVIFILLSLLLVVLSGKNSSIVRRFEFEASSGRIESRHVKLVTVRCARDWFAERCFEFENTNN